MKREELDNMLQELTKDDITVDRRLEIFKAIQDDKDNSLSEIDELNTKNAKLVDDYKTLEKKRVDDFFNQGRESKDAKKEFENNGNENEVNPNQVTIDDILED